MQIMLEETEFPSEDSDDHLYFAYTQVQISKNTHTTYYYFFFY